MHTALSADVEAAVGGGKWSGSFRCGQLQALDPGLMLCAHVADKSSVILAKQHPQPTELVSYFRLG